MEPVKPFVPPKLASVEEPEKPLEVVASTAEVVIEAPPHVYVNGEKVSLSGVIISIDPKWNRITVRLDGENLASPIDICVYPQVLKEVK